MKISNNFTTSIHIVLRDLIEQKSERDRVRFTSAQLANALCMPRSMITKLTHPEQSKRVINPRIDTLLKIVEFFRSDGFNITVNDLLGITTKSIIVQEQNNITQQISRKIPLYSFNANADKKLGTIDIKISSDAKNIFALHADKDIKPLFKQGSIFIIDQDEIPEEDTLVAINLKEYREIQIKKYHIENNKIILKSIDPEGDQLIVNPSIKLNILGVIIQVNAKT